MIDFQPLAIKDKQKIESFLRRSGERGCEYSFVNLFLWGRQKCAVVYDNLVCFSQYNRKSVYLFPVGPGDKQKTLEEIISDAAQRGIPCRLVGLTGDDCALLEGLYPGKLRYHFARDSFDYVYAIDDLADLKGRKFQKKRNHLNRFYEQNPDARLEEITHKNLPAVAAFVKAWYQDRQLTDPHGDFLMEQAAMNKALENREALGLEGMLLRTAQGVVAITLGSLLRDNTFDIHFEKAASTVDGAYAAINNGFAKHLRQKYPQLEFLDREDDMGIEGLRKAKLSYNPHHLVEKSWACLLEEGYDY